MGFPTHSLFADDSQGLAQDVVEAKAKDLPKALFASTTSGWQGEIVEIKSGQLRSWWHDIDDALSEVEDGSMRGLERAVMDLETLRGRIDDVIRSANGTLVHSDRTAG